MDVLTNLFSSIIDLVFENKLFEIDLALWILTPLLLSVILKLFTGRK